MENSLTIFEQLRVASLFEVFLVALLMLPFFLGFFSLILREISEDRKSKQRWYVGLAILYFIGIGILKYGDFSTKKFVTASQEIKSYLKNEQWEIMGFERIRENINTEYNDEFLERVIELTPEFSKVKLTSTTDSLGIKYIYDSQSLNYFEARMKIETSMKRDSFTILGFERIRQNVDSRYDDALLEELVDRYPEVFERIPLSGIDSKGIKLKEQ